MDDPRQAVLAALRQVLEPRPEVRVAVLFGSGARGTGRRDSDVDVGIIASGLEPHSELSLQAELEKAVGRTVDLVRLDEASTLVRWHVARDGAPVLERGRKEWVRFVAAAASEYADLEPALRTAGNLYRARLMQAGHR